MTETAKKLRKVAFNKFITAVYVDLPQGGRGPKPGTNCMQTNFPNTGLFHQWASDYEEFESGPANCTVALVELPDGTIAQIHPSNLKFLDPA